MKVEDESEDEALDIETSEVSETSDADVDETNKSKKKGVKKAISKDLQA